MKYIIFYYITRYYNSSVSYLKSIYFYVMWAVYVEHMKVGTIIR